MAYPIEIAEVPGNGWDARVDRREDGNVIRIGVEEGVQTTSTDVQAHRAVPAILMKRRDHLRWLLATNELLVRGDGKLRAKGILLPHKA